MPYFDANATTPLHPAAAAAAAQAQQEHWHNPSSPYPAAAAVHNRLEAARARLAGYLGCEAQNLVFNSGASEGAFSIFHYLSDVLGSEARVAISAIEHPCVRESARRFFKNRVDEIPVGANGVLCLNALDSLLGAAAAKRPSLVAVMAANNETGILQPWGEVLERCHRHGVPCLIDASQWLGKQPAAGLGQADFLIGCAHKFGGSKGVGFLKIGDDFTGFSAQSGGSQEHGHRAGTENYPAVSAMLAALEAHEAQPGKNASAPSVPPDFPDDDSKANDNHNTADNRNKPDTHPNGQGRDAFEAAVLAAIPGTVVNGRGAPRLGNTSSLTLPRFRNSRWVSRLAKLGFYVSTGSACASGKAGPSYVLAAMGLPPEQAERTVRVSALWWPCNESCADWLALAAAFAEVWAQLQAEEDGGDNSSLTSVISF